MSTVVLPPVAPEILAEAVEQLSARLRKKLDAAIASCAANIGAAADGSVDVPFGEDAVVSLRPGPSGAIVEAGQAVCTCLLAPRCLHRAAVLGAAPIADAGVLSGTGVSGELDVSAELDGSSEVDGSGGSGESGRSGESSGVGDSNGPGAARGAAKLGVPSGGDGSGDSKGSAGSGGSDAGHAVGATTPDEPAPALTAAQVRAATALWQAAAEALSAGVTAGGAVVQAEVLCAAHTVRLAGLPRAEAAALRVVRGLRAARDSSQGQRLGDLTGAFRDLLTEAALLASGSPGAGATGSVRRAYGHGGNLRVYGLCREPVLSATGYGGVATHLMDPDGACYTVSDVRPGGLARAKGAGTASVALGGAVLDHGGLARGGLRIVGATVSPDGRLGAGRGVSATPLRGVEWSDEPVAALFARPVHEAMAAALDDGLPGDGGTAPPLLGCDVVVVGAAGEYLMVRVADGGPLLRLLPAHPHPGLPFAANLRRIAEYPGLALRVLGRPDLERAATLRPLAVGPVPGASHTLRLPDEWLGRADLGYDRLQGSLFPPGKTDAASAEPVTAGLDPLADAPLWRVRRLLETGVAGGRRAVAEAGRGAETAAFVVPLRRAGLGGAAHLAETVMAEADRRPRDAFGRLTDASAAGYARAWLASAVHLAAAERSLVAASWS
ncbi:MULTISPECIES: hypothetical protein [unclassified Streptomyces]|uniref:hypothetical protein n=1 Tax=unclassified Streptomyces TaxID=2593676 RepID=UPI0006F3C1B6|nr:MULTISPECIES: hypothetical protein [unclassified Streptomyces]KQX50080.1 hypothetical protein ASD33_15815 [Streptomyces sp. Root1304]KRA79877.1 hypothetical protein ASE09_17095 [Streptomyces sp. Root66D1]